MSFSDKIALTKENRIIEKFTKIKEKWISNIEKFSKDTGRYINESLLFKSDNYRLKRENIEALDVLKSEHERYGDYYWYMTLRKFDIEKKEKKEKESLKNKINKIGKEKRMDVILKYACEQQNNNEKTNLNVDPVLRFHDLPDGFKSDLIETKNHYFERIRKSPLFSSLKTDDSNTFAKKTNDSFNFDDNINDLGVFNIIYEKKLIKNLIFLFKKLNFIN